MVGCGALLRRVVGLKPLSINVLCFCLWVKFTIDKGLICCVPGTYPPHLCRPEKPTWNLPRTPHQGQRLWRGEPLGSAPRSHSRNWRVSHCEPVVPTKSTRPYSRLRNRRQRTSLLSRISALCFQHSHFESVEPNHLSINDLSTCLWPKFPIDKCLSCCV